MTTQVLPAQRKRTELGPSSDRCLCSRLAAHFAFGFRVTAAASPARAEDAAEAAAGFDDKRHFEDLAGCCCLNLKLSRIIASSQKKVTIVVK